jgi:hypothetical protein
VEDVRRLACRPRADSIFYHISGHNGDSGATGDCRLRLRLLSIKALTALLCHPESDSNAGRGQDRAYDAGPSRDHCPSQSGGLLSRFNSRLFDKPIFDVAASNIPASETGNGRTAARSMQYPRLREAAMTNSTGESALNLPKVL